MVNGTGNDSHLFFSFSSFKQIHIKRQILLVLLYKSHYKLSEAEKSWNALIFSGEKPLWELVFSASIKCIIPVGLVNL